MCVFAISPRLLDGFPWVGTGEESFLIWKWLPSNLALQRLTATSIGLSLVIMEDGSEIIYLYRTLVHLLNAKAWIPFSCKCMISELVVLEMDKNYFVHHISTIAETWTKKPIQWRQCIPPWRKKRPGIQHLMVNLSNLVTNAYISPAPVTVGLLC
jgi:hypothetical protein